jgi:hypothetical protein
VRDGTQLVRPADALAALTDRQTVAHCTIPPWCVLRVDAKLE